MSSRPASKRPSKCVARTSPARQRRPRSRPRWLVLLGGVGIVVALAAFLMLRGPSGAGQSAWMRFNTQDVHSLAFLGGDPNHLLFGHHTGLYESRDGGRKWTSLPPREDAMSMAPATDGSIVIAGHLVFTASRDNGATWTPVATDLPSLDIHGFTRDPGDPARMWAYLATGGLWESMDSGAHFMQVREDNVLFPTAVRESSTLKLLAVDIGGISASSDGGRIWTVQSVPPFTPVTSLTATPDGKVVYGGAPNGLFRSTDGGRTWTKTAYRGSVFAVATTPDGLTVAVVSRETELFRSADGGVTWPGPM